MYTNTKYHSKVKTRLHTTYAQEETWQNKPQQRLIGDDDQTELAQFQL